MALAATTMHRRLPPRFATALITFTLVLVVAAAVPTTVVLAVAFAGHTPWFDRQIEWCMHTIGDHEPVPTWLAALAAAWLPIGGVRVARVVRARRRLACRDHGPLVVADDPAPYAVTMPGRGGRIVVSTGLMDSLDEREAAVVLAHEAAHARFRHDRFVYLAGLVTAALPVLWFLTRRLRFSVERWADESAAETCGDRQFVAVTLGKVALIDTAPVAWAGFANLNVFGRVRLLLMPPASPPRAPGQLALAVALGLVGAATVQQLTHIPHLLHELCH
ncbi:MAG: M56 family metallopeptidase [Acidimicrobiales bacterium]|nr:M56 family metallopeptidase [Acidimicrobiales bacterium]MCB9395144.1 M56 family metallopeptidase [Acidimicrobiaceae bacterium]